MKAHTNRPINRSLHLGIGIVFGTLLGITSPGADADELSELYLNSTSTNTSATIAPNILFIIDTSGSMKSWPGYVVDPEEFYGAAFDPNTTYPGTCIANHIYRKSWEDDGAGNLLVDGNGFPIESGTGKDNFQSCGNPQYGFSKSTLVCKPALDAINGSLGWWAGGVSEFRPQKTYLDNRGDSQSYHVEDGVELSAGQTSGVDMDGEWHSLSQHLSSLDSYNGVTIWRDCPDDIGVHGWNDTTTEVWPSDETASGYRTTEDSGESSAVRGVNKQVLASGNYLNWFNYVQTRLAVVQVAIKEIVTSIPNGTRIGLMRFDASAANDSSDSTQGGMMIKEFVEAGIGSNTQDFIDVLFDIHPWEGSSTPLSESLLEAVYVYRGSAVKFGTNSNIQDENGDRVDMPSISASRNDTNPGNSGYRLYESPIEFECQKSAAIVLSDGDPTSDCNVLSSPGDASTLANFLNYTYPDFPSDGDCGCGCMPYLAEYLANEDLSSIIGKQVVTTHTVGFGPDISQAGQDYLKLAAEKGDGTFTMANSVEELKQAFRLIFREEIAKNASISSPAVTVNAFNRKAHEDKLYFTVFDPQLASVHWPGNLKKYRLGDYNGNILILDATGEPALVRNSSQIHYEALSYWTDPSDPALAQFNGADGNQTRLGGAAGEITDSNVNNRKLYTYTGSNADLTNLANAFASSNTLITNAMLGLASTSTQRDNVIDYMRGIDLKDEDGDGSTADARRAMGAAPHGVPAIVTYGTDPSTATQVIYVPTNDGFLHAIDGETGKELWAFLAPESMGNFADMYTTPTSSYIGYGLDGSVVPYIEGYDTTDRKWLFFGMRRGGRSIYALDVTDKSQPKILWHISGGASSGFDDLAQTWSDPQIAKIRVGSTDTGTPVLVFGGGYDAATQDGTAADTGYVDDTMGNAVYIVRADTGARLWSAGDNAGHSLIVTDMKSSIAAALALKDKNEDGFADMIVAADVGGRIFRFDISTTSTGFDVTGGMIASLGADGNTSASNSVNRKFFARPDVVLAARDGDTYWAINIASGDRERPKSNMTNTSNGTVGTENYLFSIKERPVFGIRNDYTNVVRISELFDATSNSIQDGTATLADLAGKSGWMVKLERNGEKGLSEAKTFDYRVFYTSFDPTPLDTSSCNSDPGTARIYALDLVTAGAVIDLDGDGDIDKDDRDDELTHGTVPPAVTFIFLEDSNGHVQATSLIGRSDDKAALGTPNVIRKTFWHISTTDDEL